MRLYVKAAQHLPQERGVGISRRIFIRRKLFGIQDEGQRNVSWKSSSLESLTVKTGRDSRAILFHSLIFHVRQQRTREVTQLPWSHTGVQDSARDSASQSCFSTVSPAWPIPENPHWILSGKGTDMSLPGPPTRAYTYINAHPCTHTYTWLWWVWRPPTQQSTRLPVHQTVNPGATEWVPIPFHHLLRDFNLILFLSKYVPVPYCTGNGLSPLPGGREAQGTCWTSQGNTAKPWRSHGMMKRLRQPHSGSTFPLHLPSPTCPSQFPLKGAN